ncbi:MAG: UDP-N-acetylmuramate dehydrogenase [Gemmataceae bacterium]|nr:UDP-N-acetylmuramate dehydrogenase [Gemmataceae bacterium]
MTETAPGKLQEFAEILKPKEPLGPYTIFKVGGPAEFFAQPRTIQELSALVKRCHELSMPFRILGVGGNVLVRDEGVKGVVARLGAAPFVDVKAQGKRIRAGCGSSIAALIAAAARSGLGGLEPLVGMPGTVGGALRHNAGERSTEIGQFVRSVDVMDLHGNIQTREQDELRFSYRSSNLDDPVLLVAELELEPERSELIVKHLQKAWIERKASHPFSYQAAGRIFKNPPGLSAAALIEEAGLVGAKVGGAHVNERDANFFVVEPSSSARDVVRLIELVKTRVQEKFKTDLELEMSIW